MAEKPKVTNSLAEKELDKAEKQFESFAENVKDLTLDRMNMAPKVESESPVKLSSREINKLPEHYLKPHRQISSREKFNETYRDQWEFAKQYVPFIAENKEVNDGIIDMWTKPFAGIPAQWWQVPTNKPVFGPRHLAEQIKRKTYHRLVMDENAQRGAPTAQGMSGGGPGGTEYQGRMVAQTTVQRLDAHPVSDKKSVFVGVA